MRMEMHAPEVTCSVIALVIPFTGLACFAIRKKRLVGRGVDGHPHFARLSVDSVRMTAQLMLTAEAVRIVGAYWTLEPQHSAGRSL